MSNGLPRFLDFTRPGNDLVDDMRYPPFIRFWRRYGRNFLKLIQLNLLYSLMTLPIYVWITSLLNGASVQKGGGVFTLLGSLLLSGVMDWPAPVLIVLVLGAILLLGPATAALTYAALNCAWDRPGLFWAGFWEAFRENWKQAMLFGILDVFAMFATAYYMIDGRAAFGSAGVVLMAVWGLMALLYAMMRVYLYPVMVTVQLSTGALIRNSLFLALLKPWRAIAVVAAAAAMALLCVVADIVMVPCFMYSFVAFMAAFVTEPVIGKYLIHPNSFSTDQTETEQEE